MDIEKITFKIFPINKGTTFEQTRIEAYYENKIIDGLIIDEAFKNMDDVIIEVFKGNIIHNILKKECQRNNL